MRFEVIEGEAPRAALPPSTISAVHRALIQLVTPSEVAIAVSIAAIVWIMNFQVSRFFIFLRF